MTRKCSAGRGAAPKKAGARRMPRRLNQEQERLHDGSRMAEAKTKQGRSLEKKEEGFTPPKSLSTWKVWWIEGTDGE